MTKTVEILKPARRVRAKSGETLAEVLVRSGVRLDTACGRRGICGKCFVRIVRGPLPPLEDNEGRLLERAGLSCSHRLACLYKITTDVKVDTPRVSLAEEVQVLTAGVGRTVPLDPEVRKFSLRPSRPHVAAPDAFLDLLQRSLKMKDVGISPSALDDLARSMSDSRDVMTVVLHGKKDILAVESGDTVNRNFGLAVDLGTTTLVIELVDLQSGKIVDRTTAVNSQTVYGSDIVSRISLAVTRPEKASALRKAVLDDLNRMTKEVLERNNLSPDCVYEAVVAGNTAMNHLLLGQSVSSLALAPFNPVFSVLPPLRAEEAGLTLHRNGRVFIVPNMKGFIGGDVTAGMIAAGLDEVDGTYLYIDLGTNGEVALVRNRSLLVTSTAAGPAFEGMTISCGMLAEPGAIDRVIQRGEGRLDFSTVGGIPPRGLCGTGLIDLVALSLRKGNVTPSGNISTPSRKLLLTEEISLLQKDVRELQLAVAAVRAGVQGLLTKARLSPLELDGISIAGAFGSELNIENSMALGLLPSVKKKKVRFLGNASLAGARALLLSSGFRARAKKLASRAKHVSLAAEPGFQETFIHSTEFGRWK